MFESIADGVGNDRIADHFSPYPGVSLITKAPQLRAIRVHDPREPVAVVRGIFMSKILFWNVCSGGALAYSDAPNFVAKLDQRTCR